MWTKEEKREYAKQWRKKYPEYIRQWKNVHPDYDKLWHKIHLEKAKEDGRQNSKQYYKIHSKQVRQRTKQYQLEHPEKISEYNAKHRKLGFIPLNSYHEEDEFHHIDKTYGIYIPKAIHKSVYHNQSTKQGMDEINAVAWNYL